MITGVSHGQTMVSVIITVNNFTFDYPVLVTVSDFGFSGYQVEEEYLKIPPKLSVSAFEGNITYDNSYSFEYEGNVNHYIGTGIIFKVYRNGVFKDDYVIIVLGDVSGDGNLNYLDYVKVYNHIQKVKNPASDKQLLVNEYLRAADMSENGKVDYLDYVRIYNKIIELKG